MSTEAAPATPVKAPAVKVVKAKKVPAKPKKIADHPPFAEMVKAAVAALKERTGSSKIAIVKYIKANNKVGDSSNFNTLVKAALKKAVTSGELKQVKGTGASGSFKLADKKKAEPKKKPAAKKAKSPAKTKKPAAAKKAKSPAKKVVKKAAKSPAKKVAAKPKAAAKKPAAAKKVAAKPKAVKKVAKPKAVKKTPTKKAAKK